MSKIRSNRYSYHSSVNARFAMSISNQPITIIRGHNLKSISFLHRKNNIWKTKETSFTNRRLSGRRCYLGRGWQNVLSRPGLTECAISDAFFSSSNFVVVALRSPWLNLYFYRIGVWKSWIILDVIFWRWLWQFTIHRRVGARTSHLSSARKNVPSQARAFCV